MHSNHFGFGCWERNWEERGTARPGPRILALLLGPLKQTCYIWEGKGGIKTTYGHGKGERSTPYIIGRSRNYPQCYGAAGFLLFALFPPFFFLPLWRRLQSTVRAAPGTVQRSTARSPRSAPHRCLFSSRLESETFTFACKFPVLWSLASPLFSLINRSD